MWDPTSWSRLQKFAQIAPTEPTAPTAYPYKWEVKASGIVEIDADSPEQADEFARDRFNQNLGAIIQDSWDMSWTGQIASHDGRPIESIPWKQAQRGDPDLAAMEAEQAKYDEAARLDEARQQEILFDWIRRNPGRTYQEFLDENEVDDNFQLERKL